MMGFKAISINVSVTEAVSVSKQWWDLKERLAVIDVILVAVLVNNDGI